MEILIKPIMFCVFFFRLCVTIFYVSLLAKNDKDAILFSWLFWDRTFVQASKIGRFYHIGPAYTNNYPLGISICYFLYM